MVPKCQNTKTGHKVNETFGIWILSPITRPGPDTQYSEAGEPDTRIGNEVTSMPENFSPRQAWNTGCKSNG